MHFKNNLTIKTDVGVFSIYFWKYRFIIVLPFKFWLERAFILILFDFKKKFFFLFCIYLISKDKRKALVFFNVWMDMIEKLFYKYDKRSSNKHFNHYFFHTFVKYSPSY